MVDLASQIKIGVQHSHNTTGDFVCRFDGVMFGETIVNPSNEGFTFFRPQGVSFEIDQVTAITLAHTILEPIGGLNAVVVFGSSMGSSTESAITIAKDIRKLMPDTKIIMVANNNNGLFDNGQVIETDAPQDFLDDLKLIDIEADKNSTSLAVKDYAQDRYDFEYGEEIDDEGTRLIETDYKFELAEPFDHLLKTSNNPEALRKIFTERTSFEGRTYGLKTAFYEAHPLLVDWNLTIESGNWNSLVQRVRAGIPSKEAREMAPLM